MPLHVPTDEELKDWFPDPAQKRFRVEIDVRTKQRKEIELTLDEYRARHKAKMISQNEAEAKRLAAQQEEERKRVLDKLIEEGIARGL